MHLVQSTRHPNLVDIHRYIAALQKSDTHAGLADFYSPGYAASREYYRPG
ncbi:MAG: hypothetical protein GXY34_00450 [Syntrophomonadaceae bacterium]|nr:hypothetical protein [Syntrophomonadaceae bacterium]